MKAPFPLPVEKDRAGAIDQQGGQGEDQDADRAVAIERIDALSPIGIDRENRRHNSGGESCDKSEIKDQHAAHDALFIRQAHISPGD